MEIWATGLPRGARGFKGAIARYRIHTFITYKAHLPTCIHWLILVHAEL